MTCFGFNLFVLKLKAPAMKPSSSILIYITDSFFLFRLIRSIDNGDIFHLFLPLDMSKVFSGYS